MPCSKSLESNLKPRYAVLFEAFALLARLAFPPKTWAVLGYRPHGGWTLVHPTFVVILAPQHGAAKAGQTLAALVFSRLIRFLCRSVAPVRFPSSHAPFPLLPADPARSPEGG
jgi:hypothetical protein